MGVMQLLEGDTEEAIASLERAQNGNARLPFVHAYLAAAYALKGQTRRAQTELAEARARSNAYSSLASVMNSSWYDDPKIRSMAEATYFKGLRAAGVPEK